jgi:hypothetical protein
MAGRRKVCFVIGPIGGHGSPERVHADTLFDKIIKPTFDEHFPKISVVRADHIATPGMIDTQIITHLIEAKLAIADLTTQNANAFYELGIRHMLQKPVVHVFRRGERIPADIAAYRAVEIAYSDESEIAQARAALKTAVGHTQIRGFAVDNPVTRSQGYIRLRNPKPKKLTKYRNGTRLAPIVENAPSVIWLKRPPGAWEARWQTSRQAIDEGFGIKSVKLWSGVKTDLKRAQRDFIADAAKQLEGEQSQFIEQQTTKRLELRKEENA